MTSRAQLRRISLPAISQLLASWAPAKRTDPARRDQRARLGIQARA